MYSRATEQPGLLYKGELCRDVVQRVVLWFSSSLTFLCFLNLWASRRSKGSCKYSTEWWSTSPTKETCFFPRNARRGSECLARFITSPCRGYFGLTTVLQWLRHHLLDMGQIPWGQRVEGLPPNNTLGTAPSQSESASVLLGEPLQKGMKYRC